MYNGIGLTTARGSGTSGHVQKNLSFIKPKPKSEYNYDENPAAPPRKPSDDVLLHKSRRQVENDVLEYREKLETEKRFTDEEIEERVKEKRKELLDRLDERLKSTKESVLMEAKEREMIKMKDAFGIRDGAEEGQAFRFESEKQRRERLERIAQEEQARRTRF